MPDSDELGQLPCCDGPDCCSSTPPNRGGGGGAWRTAIFTIVIVLAAAVAAYSLFWRESAVTGCVPGSSDCTAACGGIQTIAGLEENLAGLDFALVVLTRPSDELSSAITVGGWAAIDSITAGGAKANMLIVPPDHTAFATASAKFNIDTYPAVIALGKTGSAALSREEISYKTILATYQKLSPVQPACAPADSTRDKVL